MVDACVANGILPFYGPFGDIKDTVACEDQFRNAYLLGCVGAWSLHPVQIDIAKRVFSPDPTDVAHAKRVVAAMGDGTGAVMLDGKMEDDASVKQCRVILELARQLAERDPALAETYASRAEGRPPWTSRAAAPPVGALHAGRQRAGAGEGEDDPRRRPDPRPRGRGGPRRQGRRPRAGVRGGARPAATAGKELVIRVNGLDTAVGTPTTSRPPAKAGPDAILVPKVDSVADVAEIERASSTAGAPDHTRIWAMIETPLAICSTLETIAGASERLAVLVMGTNDIAKELHAEQVPGREPLLFALSACLARRPRAPARSSSTASTTTSPTPTASRPSASRAASWASTARR